MILLLIPSVGFVLWYWRADKTGWSHGRAVGAFFLSLAAASWWEHCGKSLSDVCRA